MNKFIFGIYDNKALLYSNPFYSVREEVALRDFATAINDPKSDLYNNPGDYDLFKFGTYEDEHGLFVTDRPVFIQNGAFLRKFDSEQ